MNFATGIICGFCSVACFIASNAWHNNVPEQIGYFSGAVGLAVLAYHFLWGF